MRRAIHPQQTQAFFVRGPSPFSRLVVFAALSLTLMATDSRLHYLTEIRQGFIALLHPLQMIANAPFNAYESTQEYFSTHNTLLKENTALKQQALFQSAELQRLKSLENENANLRNLLGAAEVVSQPAKLGEILHMGRDPFVHRIVVNLGAHHDIVAGQAVIDGAGVIGQVTRVYPFSSEVTLITDKDLAIPVQIERNGLRAIAFGHGRDTSIDLPYLPANVDIRQGDKLVTSGIDGIYPTGLAVAEVVSVSSNPNSPFAHIVCKPVAGIENHRQVLLLGLQQPETASGIAANAASTSKESTAKASAANKPPAAVKPVVPMQPVVPVNKPAVPATPVAITAKPLAAKPLEKTKPQAKPNASH